MIILSSSIIGIVSILIIEYEELWIWSFVNMQVIPAFRVRSHKGVVKVLTFCYVSIFFWIVCVFITLWKVGRLGGVTYVWEEGPVIVF